MREIRRIVIHISIMALAMLFLACAGNQQAQQEMDKKLKAVADQNSKFQKMAIQKIGALEKDVKALKNNQKKMAKQIPAIVKQIKVLKAAVARTGKGATPEMEAQINDILANLESLESDLNKVREEETLQEESPPEPEEPFGFLEGTDQEMVFNEYGRPGERYTIANHRQVWLYDSGVVVFDEKGSLISLKFE